MSGIHAMAACSHKWMLGLLGIGFLFVDRDLLPDLRPTVVGWHSVEDPFAFDGTRFELRGDASRLEEATTTFPMVYGLGAAVELLLEANALHRSVGDGVIGVCPDDERQVYVVVYSALFAADSLNLARFDRALRDFVEMAETWRERISGLVPGSGDGGDDDSTSDEAGRLMRV